MKWLDSIIDSMDMNLSKLWKIVEAEEPGVLQSSNILQTTGLQKVEHDIVAGQQQQSIKELGGWEGVCSILLDQLRKERSQMSRSHSSLSSSISHNLFH